MLTVNTIAEARAACTEARAEGRSVGLVPTMGAFHAGHRSLMATARGECDFVVVSLFVNPTQFSPNEDLAAYPRDLHGDTGIAEAVGVDLMFVPTVEAMYPEPGRTTVHVGGLTTGLCGGGRPGHFDGVATVVTKLFAIAGPCRAYFGRKDAQQLAVVRRLVRDLDLPVEVVGCPLVRDDDGLAMSSRNAYLDAEERAGALVLLRALRAGVEAVTAGLRDGAALRALVAAAITGVGAVTLEYAEVVDPTTLEPIVELDRTALVAVAARVGRARLIDNVTLDLEGERVTADLGITADGVPIPARPEGERAGDSRSGDSRSGDPVPANRVSP